MKNKIIRGSGGGDEPPQQHIPAEDSDTLRSKAFLRLVDLISEGEIVGLVDGDRSVYFDETPLANEDGTLNFSGVTYEGRVGTQTQDYLAGFNTVENEITVGVEIKNESGGEVIRQVTDPNINQIKVRLLVPALTSTEPSTGDVHGASVSVSLYIRPSAGSYALAATRTISGKSSGRYEVDLQAVLTGDGPWDIKMVRNTADSQSSYLQNKTFFESFTEIIDAKLKYPNSAYIGLRIDAQQFQNVPDRAYDVKLLKIQIPDNYDPETRVYTGSWGGNFQTAWSDNPAWVLYDLLVSNRYGLGDFIDATQIDKWALYEIAQYCDELVSDGFGGTEPRFTCNLMLANREEAYTILQNMASVFRGMVYWAGGSITPVADSPQDAFYLFTPSNVSQGLFNYEGASAKAKHTVALVSWNDPEDFYKLKVEYVEDPEGISTYGVQQTDLVAFGCTSRGQAHRLGKWLLYTEQFESEIVTFQTGLEGLPTRPGQIIKIADPTKAGLRMGGRISSATTGSITIDADPSGGVAGFLISALLPDGSLEERTVVGQSGRVLSVQPDFSVAPNAQSIWVLKSDEVEPQFFRVLGIKEGENSVFTVSAIRHDPQKFGVVESDLDFQSRSYSNLKAITDPPENIRVVESLYLSGADVKTKITVAWDKVDRAVSYIVRYRRDDENFLELKESQFNDQEILDAQPGMYTFQVSAINAVGKRSSATELSKEIFGKTALPSNVQGFSMIPNAGQAYLTWTRSVDLDVLVGGQIRIRHTPRIVAQQWSDGIDIVPAIAGTATSCVAPLLTGTYMAKFVDSSGNFSAEETLVITTIPYGLALNVVDTIDEDPGFSGTKTNMVVDTINGALVLADSTLWDDLPLIDSVGSIDFPGSIISSGSYDFANAIDLGGVWPSRIYSIIDLQAFDIGTVIDSRTDLIDDWSDIDGGTINDVNAELFVRTTEDDPLGSPTWTDWKRIHAGAYSFWGAQFQLRCTSDDPTHNLYIKQLEVTVDMEDRAESMGGAKLTSGAGSYAVVYPEAFFAAPSIQITAENLATGDFYQITSASKTGFTIVFKNSAGTAVSRDFYVLSKGYGRRTA